MAVSFIVYKLIVDSLYELASSMPYIMVGVNCICCDLWIVSALEVIYNEKSKNQLLLLH
jgi:hypothetical protein